jgi:hypothetical protein
MSVHCGEFYADLGMCQEELEIKPRIDPDFFIVFEKPWLKQTGRENPIETESTRGLE